MLRLTYVRPPQKSIQLIGIYWKGNFIDRVPLIDSEFIWIGKSDDNGTVLFSFHYAACSSISYVYYVFFFFFRFWSFDVCPLMTPYDVWRWFFKKLFSSSARPTLRLLCITEIFISCRWTSMSNVRMVARLNLDAQHEDGEFEFESSFFRSTSFEIYDTEKF